MSGLKNEPYEGSNFVNFKDGRLVSNKETYTSLTGLITELDLTDEEYKGKEYRKITLFIKDDEDNILKLGFPLESGYGNSFCSLAPNIDFAKPVQISGGTKELENGNSYGSVFIRQGFDENGKGGKSVKWYFKKDGAQLPAGAPIINKAGKTTGMDFSERNDFFHHLLLEQIRPRILEGAKRSGNLSATQSSADKALQDLGFKKTSTVKKK